MAADTLHRRSIADPAGLPGAFAVATVGLQIAYPLVEGSTRDRLTVAIVVVLAAASLFHVAATLDVRSAVVYLMITAGVGSAVELLGVHTGFPFGRYEYGSSLGPRVAGVPVAIVLAWTMFAWPALLVARRLVDGRATRVVVGAVALASWDLFLDPQMVAAGHWHWRFPSPHLPGVPSVPLTNYAGWLATALVVSAGLQRLLGDRVVDDDRWPLVLYVWTYFSSVVALAVFLDLAAAAAWGALGMGLVVVPLLWHRLRSR
jgi:putative membrane protein